MRGEVGVNVDNLGGGEEVARWGQADGRSGYPTARSPACRGGRGGVVRACRMVEAHRELASPHPNPPLLHVGEGADPHQAEPLWGLHITYIYMCDTDLPSLSIERPDITAKRPTRLMAAPAPAFTLARSNRFPASTPARCFRGPVPRAAGSSRKRYMISPQSRLDWRGWRRVSYFRQPRFFFAIKRFPPPLARERETTHRSTP